MNAAREPVSYTGCDASAPGLDGPIGEYIIASLGSATVVDVLPARNHADHEAPAERQTRPAWETWSPHCRTIRNWAEGCDV